MAASAAHAELIEQARRFFADFLVNDAQTMLDVVVEGAHELAERPAERALSQQRHDMVQNLHRDGAGWPRHLAERVQEQASPNHVLDSGASALVSSMQGQKDLTLVDDATVRREIIISRVALAIMDRSAWELTDLRARVMQLADVNDFADDDIFRPQVLARCFVKSWTNAGLSVDTWHGLESVLHKVLARRAEEAYHETNRWLIEQGVLPEVDLRPFIRRSDGTPTQAGSLDETPPPAPQPGPEVQRPAGAPVGGPSAGAAVGAGSREVPASWRSLFTRATGAAGVGYQDAGAGTGGAGPSGPGGPGGASAYRGSSGNGGPGPGGAGPGSGSGASLSGRSGSGGGGQGGAEPAASAWSQAGGPGTTGYTRGYDDETRLMTRPVGGVQVRADVVLEQFGQIMERHLPGFRDTAQARPASERLSNAMAKAQHDLAAQVDAAGQPGAAGPADLNPAQVIHELRERQQALKQAAATPAERATIELVALLFQSILTDDRIPATVRVWFARLQMPTLRVAIAEPDFFSSVEHPARKLIDRMGSCVMGFEGDANVVGPALEAEIKRIVQVVEAFPDTGRRVFQTVLNEFEKFIEKYYADQDDTTRMGISLAQQVEQRETLAIQYTIEMRKLLNEVPVQEGVRDFLFHIWADVLATTAVRHGGQSAEVRGVREAATELMWTASAKTTREERAEVIRRLPPLLATLRKGMSSAGMSAQRQEDAIKALNLALTAAFGARAVTVTSDQLEHLKRRLETIEELIPDDDFEIDDAWVLDEASHSQDGLEVVADGGSMPGPAMIDWAMQLRLGDSFTLDYRGRHDVVRLVWQGMHRQLSLFVTNQSRCVLFQKARLAAFLQAGLLLPLQEESLTVTATRDAIRKIEADPSRLVH